MNKEAQRIAIARATGWSTWKGLYGDYLMGMPPDGHPLAFDVGLTGAEVPDYLTDLNAMHEAEKTLTDDQYANFNNLLADMCERSQDGVYPTRMVSAIPIMRAEALLRAIGKWEES